MVNGNVVGWFQGRMEWGPRALGNRSIVTHPGLPGLPDMKDVLNARIKHREWFRPFAPSILADRQHEYFEHDHPSPFMLHVYKIKPAWRDKLSAVNHADDTGRLQTVSKEENHRKNAAETVDLAVRATSTRDKSRLLALAEAWLNLAERAKRSARRKVPKPRDLLFRARPAAEQPKT